MLQYITPISSQEIRKITRSGGGGGWGGEPYLEKADNHEDEAVGADTPRPHLIQVSLQQELLQDEHHERQAGILDDEFLKSEQKSHHRHALMIPSN